MVVISHTLRYGVNKIWYIFTIFVSQKMAGSGLLNFIVHTQKHIVPHLSNPVRYHRNRHLSIDANTRRALEIIKYFDTTIYMHVVAISCN